MDGLVDADDFLVAFSSSSLLLLLSLLFLSSDDPQTATQEGIPIMEQARDL